MKRTSQLLRSLFVFAFLFVVSMPGIVHAHGGIGGFHAGGFHAGGFHAGGFHAGGVHVGGVHVGGVAGGFNHVGVYPHYHAGVGYYHPVARAAAWGAAYNNASGDGGYNPNPYRQGAPLVAGADTNTTSGDSAAAKQSEKQLDEALKADKDK
jgi:hypothetical protein